MLFINFEGSFIMCVSLQYFGVTGSGITPYSSGSRSSGNSSGGDVSGPIGISLIFL